VAPMNGLEPARKKSKESLLFLAAANTTRANEGNAKVERSWPCLKRGVQKKFKKSREIRSSCGGKPLRRKSIVAGVGGAGRDVVSVTGGAQGKGSHGRELN
jgi:hypothetical protein